MTLTEFKNSVKQSDPPGGISPALYALWLDAKGEWSQAHETAQGIDDKSGAWIHAYLHRKEGDKSNASYWYARSGKSFSRLSLTAEWDEIAEALLDS